jgi:uncharacterized cupredoxin-like copper-binding protein
MNRLTYFLAAVLMSGIMISCGQSSRQEAHDEVVQEERTEDDVLLGLESTEQQQAQVVEVVAENMEYKPKQIRVQAGEMVRIRLTNGGDEAHSMEIELPGGEEKLAQNLQPGERGTLEFTAPQQTGTYTIYCPVEDHKEKGRTGQLIVE